MRDLVTYLCVLLIVAGEAALWVENPMHVAPGFVPARAFGLQVFRELNASMEPTVRPGQYVLVSAWPYWHREPRRGDLIAFQYPDNPSVADLKRIVAVGGSRVEIRNDRVYVDGRPAAGFPSGAQLTGTLYGADRRSFRVPRGSYFVMGDNRADSSLDSRDYGFIQRAHIIGEAIWPSRRDRGR
jgi:signal peptidase I